MAKGRVEKEQQRQQALEGLPVAKTNENADGGMEVNTEEGAIDATVSDNEFMEDPLGVLE
jgi:hypothetical protein